MSRRPAAKIRIARIRVNRNGTASYDPRELWEANVAPLVTAAREVAGQAAQAARTARAQRAQAHRQPPWWQRRWLVFTAAGMAVGGAAGAVYAMARRRSQAEVADELAAPMEPSMPRGMRSTMESGRQKVAGVTRTMMHRIRHSGEATTAEQPTVGDQPRRNEMPATGSGYGTGQPR